MTTYDREDFFEVERLHRAASDGDIGEMQRLVESGYSLELFDDLGCAPIHYAVEGQHYKAVEWLLAAGANVNSNDEEHIGETPSVLRLSQTILNLLSYCSAMALTQT